MTTMLRLGSFLMLILLATPMVRECCLPVTPAPPCHESKHTDDATCASNQQAVAEPRTTLSVKPLLEHICPIVDFADRGTIQPVRFVVDPFDIVSPPPTDIYLRTGALLI
jgi:hypothetical protein